MARKTIETNFDTLSGCRGMVRKEAGLWHLSISHKNRLPTYEEIKKARYDYLADVSYVAQIFPPEDEFVNLHPFCIHLWEISERQTYSDDKRSAHA